MTPSWPARLFRGFLQFAALGVILVAFLMLPSQEASMTNHAINDIYQWIPLPWNSVIRTGVGGAMPFVLTIVVAVYLLFSLASLIGLIGLMMAAIPFGFDAVFWNHFASTTVESSPVGPAPVRIYVANTRPGAGLAHSSIYEDPSVIRRIADWVTGPAAE